MILDSSIVKNRFIIVSYGLVQVKVSVVSHVKDALINYNYGSLSLPLFFSFQFCVLSPIFFWCHVVCSWLIGAALSGFCRWRRRRGRVTFGSSMLGTEPYSDFDYMILMPLIFKFNHQLISWLLWGVLTCAWYILNAKSFCFDLRDVFFLAVTAATISNKLITLISFQLNSILVVLDDARLECVCLYTGNCECIVAWNGLASASR